MSSSIQDTFFEECEELLEAIDEGLTAIDDGNWDGETVNAVFRAVHSIKGGAGAFGLDKLVGFAHTFETVFDGLRSENQKLDGNLTQLLLRASDNLSDLVVEARGGKPADPETHRAVTNDLQAYLEAEGLGEEVDVSDFQPMVLDLGFEEDRPAQASFLIRFRPHATLYDSGNEPLFLFQALAELGEIDVTLDESRLPKLESFDHEEAYLSWEIKLTTDKSEAVVDSVFEFVHGLCDLEISEEVAGSQEDLDLDATVDVPSVKDVPSEPAKQSSNTAAPNAKAPAKPDAKAANSTLRVDLERVDRLINTVGELIINHSMLAQQIHNLDVDDLRAVENELEDFKSLAREIQECVMAIRAQPVKPLFQRMARIVREASAATGKVTRLVTEGDATEVDKTVIERLTDPMTHILRNAVDHGIEKPEARLAAGKSEDGEIRLTASHRSGSVSIEIRDDGAGLNREKIQEIAIEKGLIPRDADLSDTEIDSLLFLPGFSTASEVSNLSGRGVGMDVVRNSVMALGGRITISSTPGAGTIFTILLPLTMAVMDGMVVSVADQTMVVPITSIIETIRATEGAVHCLGPRENMLSVRGSFVPIFDVAQVLGLRAESRDPLNAVFLLVETQMGGCGALAVDAIYDQRQVVIKSLDGVCGETAGVAAATILGDGKIAMILDPESILAEAPAAKALA